MTLVDIHVDDGQCVIVCRDIHGQFYDLCNIFDKKGFPSQDKQYLFNGDFVDRGSFSVETIFTLFALKCACPLWIHLARGNHESRSLNEVHGFENRGGATEGKAHVLNRKIIVLHGGLFSRDGVTLSDIKSIQRFCQPPKRGLMRDLLWSDPQDSPGRSRSTRGEDIIFFDLLVRSHELKDKGYEISHNGKFITVFSAPNYCDRENNKGAFIVFKAPQMEPDIQTDTRTGCGANGLLQTNHDSYNTGTQQYLRIPRGGASRTPSSVFPPAKTIFLAYFSIPTGHQPSKSVALAIEKSGFKICLLLSFSMLNYLLSVTPITLGPYLLSSWLGMMPITLALVYVGTTLKDLSDNALRKALAEHGGDMNGAVAASPEADLNEPLLIKIDSQSPQDQENQRVMKEAAG
ncbi:hypothetical protein DY000_02000831 [Brassica cretica]|uniref:Serine/threonine specific protein phosphatases domain-containing protein n=1 Tax=Brassica cretica TaxID=69181 RepID=A0ABQ7CCX6_BRACR|nr:hypothetical protein DY000_02000831 [Brassica cretica]